MVHVRGLVVIAVVVMSVGNVVDRSVALSVVWIVVDVDVVEGEPRCLCCMRETGRCASAQTGLRP